MDSVQRILTSGRGSTALADTLTAQGVGFIVLRADLDPSTSRSARPLVVADALRRSPGITVAARFGPDVAPPTIDGIVVDDGLRPPMPAITVYRVGDARGTGPLLTPLDGIPRVTGGPESLAAINEARTRDGRPALGTALLTSDAHRSGVGDGPGLIVTDTPADRETDFGRVDDHSSSIRAVDDPRLTKNTAADYPVDGASLVHGQWLLNNTPNRVRVLSSGSASDATQPGRTSPASSAAAAFDGDPNTAWVSRGLESAVGRWLAIEFTEAHRDLALTVTTAKALGPDVTSLLVTTDAGSTVVSDVTPGEPTRIVAPAGPTKRVEIRAIRTADGGGGNQFAVADVQVADASTGLGYAIRHRVALPSLDAADRVDEGVLSSELGSRAECTSDGDRSRCAAALGLDPEAPGVFSRALSVPSATDVTPTVILRPRPGGTLTDLLGAPGQIRAEGASSVTDPRGTAAAAVDGDPATVWTAPEAPAPAKKNKKKTAEPHLVLRLPEPRTVSSLRITGPGDYPATPTSVTVDLGTGPQRVTVGPGGAVPLDPARTDRITITVDKTTDLIDVNDLGFARQSPPGIAEIAVLPRTGAAVADLDRPIEIGCGTDPAGPLGMGLSAGGDVHRLQVSTTARALRDGEPIVATPCPGSGVHLNAGEQEVTVNPGDAFTVDSVNLRAGPDTVGVSTPAQTGRWDATEREVKIDAAGAARVLSVPESTNPGWHARLGGVELTPIVVNGWQQGWLVPAGAAGTVSLTFDLDTPYRWTLLVGLLLVAALFVAASVRRHRSRGFDSTPRLSPRSRLNQQEGAHEEASSPLVEPDGTHTEASSLLVEPDEAHTEASSLLVEPDGAIAKSESKRPHAARTSATLAVGLIAAYLLTGPWGAAAAVVAGLVAAAVTPTVRVVVTFSAMLIATVALGTGPWNSGTAYAGYDALPQLAAVVAVSTAVTSAALPSRRFNARRRGSSTKA
jgi:arabinofuranan 3-O-arabinosyltransferase